MPLIKKSTQTLVPLTIQIPLELQKSIERVTAAAEKRDMTFELNATLARLIRNEVTRAENALGLGASGARTRKRTEDLGRPVETAELGRAEGEGVGVD